MHFKLSLRSSIYTQTNKILMIIIIMTKKNVYKHKAAQKCVQYEKVKIKKVIDKFD